MKARRLILFVVLAIAAVSPARGAGGLDVYLLRHAETVGNVTGDYSDQNQRTFSPHGLEQVKGIADKLAPLHFDAILVSPAWRTQQTILPYLEAQHLQAEIWPELVEVDCGLTGDEQHAKRIREGSEIVRVDTNAFRFRDAASTNELRPETRGESIEQIRRAVAWLRVKYRDSGKAVLLVGHGCEGSRVAESLLGLKAEGRFAPANAALIHIRIDDDGAATLLLYNDRAPSRVVRGMLHD